VAGRTVFGHLLAEAGPFKQLKGTASLLDAAFADPMSWLKI